MKQPETCEYERRVFTSLSHLIHVRSRHCGRVRSRQCGHVRFTCSRHPRAWRALMIRYTYTYTRAHQHANIDEQRIASKNTLIQRTKWILWTSKNATRELGMLVYVQRVTTWCSSTRCPDPSPPWRIGFQTLYRSYCTALLGNYLV